MQALEGKYTDLNCKFVKFQNGMSYLNDCIKQSGQVVFVISDSSRKRYSIVTLLLKITVIFP